MNKIDIAFSLKQEQEAKHKFFNINSVFLLSYKDYFLENLSIEQSFTFFQKLHIIIRKYKLKYLRKQFHGDEFIGHWIPAVSAREYIHSVFPFYEIFFSSTYNFLKHSELLLFIVEKKYDLDSICFEIKNLNEEFGLKLYNIYENEIYNYLIDFFCIIYNVYQTDYSKTEIEKIYKDIDKHYKNQQQIKFSIEESYEIKDFISLMESLEFEIWNDIHNFINESTSQGKNSYKKLREEYYFIYKYITKVIKNYEGKIQLGVSNSFKKNEKKYEIDAIINDEIIEVTTAVYKDEFKVRKLMLHNNYFNLPLIAKTSDQIGKDLIIQQIEKSINDKIKKNYSEVRTLLVGTEKEFFEYYCDYDFYYDKSSFSDILNYLKNKFSNQKSFSKIYLFLEDKPFQIY